uniref:helix-turn-helix domain-containing protein n=1 Tax=Candidatus Electrothrix sp. TaxID=2170559 RepID=UPI0040573BEA
MPHTSIQKLRERMKPEARKRATLKAHEMMAEMLIGEIRKEAGFTQEQVAELLGIRQPSLSKLESQDDMQISTLRKTVRSPQDNPSLLHQNSPASSPETHCLVYQELPGKFISNSQGSSNRTTCVVEVQLPRDLHTNS